MMLTGGIDDDDGKNNSPAGVRLAALVAPAGIVGIVVAANVVPAGAVPADDAITAPTGGFGPAAGQPAT